MPFHSGPLNVVSIRAVASGGSSILPNLIQHVSTTSNPSSTDSPAGNNYQFSFPNKVGQHNCLFAHISAPSAQTLAVSDNINGSWGSPAKSVSSGGIITSTYVMPNASAGVTILTIAGSGSWQPFQCAAGELCGIDTSTPVVATSGTASVSAPSLAAGSLTPGNGNVVLAYFGISATTGSGNPSAFTPGGGFNFLHGDIAWTGGSGFPCASQWWISNTSSSINPGIAATGDTQGYNCVAIALRAANTGTPKPAFNLDKVTATSMQGGPQTLTLQFPTTGNLRVLQITGYITITGLTDSEGGSVANGAWVAVPSTTFGTAIYYSVNKSPNAALTVSIAISDAGSPYCSRFYDVSGAATASFDLSAVAGQTSAPGSSQADIPDITPTTSNGLVVACCATGTGPALSVTAPSGVISDGVGYTGLTNTDFFNNGDWYGHIINPDTSAESWTWSLSSIPGELVWGAAAAFKHG